MYFITICCQDYISRFGNIENGQMILNDVGRMADKWYYEIENKYPDKRCREMVIMPNHFHCIIEKVVFSNDANNKDAHAGASLPGSLQIIIKDYETNFRSPYGPHNKKYGTTIGNTIGWFKTMTTNAYIRGVKKFGWEPFNDKMWQSNFYDHIIRNEQSYQKIAYYILNTPQNWESDKFYN